MHTIIVVYHVLVMDSILYHGDDTFGPCILASSSDRVPVDYQLLDTAVVLDSSTV
jgi:hypothetical protein